MNDFLASAQESLLRSVGSWIEAFGFRHVANSQDFTKPFDGGKLFFHLAFIEHDADFDVTADVAVRLDAVQDMVQAGNKFLSKKEKAQTATFGVELGNLVQGSQHRWSVTSLGDVQMVSDSLKNWFEAHALPYFSRHASLQEALDLLSPRDRSAWLHNPVHGARAKSVVSLAYLLKDQALFDQLAMEQEEYLRSLNDFSLADFQQYVQGLRGK
jgi:hypothetical protein